MKISKESLLKQDLTLIPVSEIEITYDSNEKIGYDLTVEDYFTFATQDGVFVQDCMAVYVPISKKAKQEIIDKIFISKNLINPSNGSLVTIPSQDIILGIYALTSNKLPDYTDKIIYKNQNISKGEVEFNKCLPENYPVVIGKVDRSRLLNILNDIKDLYSIEETIKVLDNVKRSGFKFATIFGTTMSLNHCKIENLEKFRDDIYSSGDIKDQLIKFSDAKIINYLKEKFKYSYMIESGARGSWDQIKQMVLSRGFLSNFNGEILKTPIKHSLLDGLSEKEFFNSTYGCRKGLLDVAINTGISGYLSRKLIFTCANLQLSKNLDDCGTTDYLQIFVDTKRKAKMLIGRYYLNNNVLQKIESKDILNLINKTIQVRSPIFCKNEQICYKCYGDMCKNLHSNYIGIIAAQILGEVLTQLVLRTFHFSGSAKINKEDIDLKQKDVVSDLSLIAKLLHKFQGKTAEIIVSELFKIYNKDIYHVHFECVIAQLMWNNSTKWRLQKNRNELIPEYLSVQSAPNRESWLLALAFSNPKKNILKGILNEGKYKGVMDKLLLGEKIR